MGTTTDRAGEEALHSPCDTLRVFLPAGPPRLSKIAQFSRQSYGDPLDDEPPYHWGIHLAYIGQAFGPTGVLVPVSFSISKFASEDAASCGELRNRDTKARSGEIDAQGVQQAR